MSVQVPLKCRRKHEKTRSVLIIFALSIQTNTALSVARSHNSFSDNGRNSEKAGALQLFFVSLSQQIFCQPLTFIVHLFSIVYQQNVIS